MATVGNNRKFYLCSGSNGSTKTWLEGEQTNSFNLSAESIEISDKSTAWAQFISGKKSATADVTVTLDNTSTSQQHLLLTALTAGSKVTCFIGIVSSGTVTEGDMFDAIVTSISDTNNQGEVSSRSISLQVTGAVTHTPTVSA